MKTIMSSSYQTHHRPKLRYLAATVLFLAILGVAPLTSVHQNVTTQQPITICSPAAIGEVVLTGVPYVWQEINGLCAWATVSIVLQYLGLHLGLHDVLAVTGVGFSFAYVRYNDTLLILPGPLYQQVEPTEFLADLYGLNQTVYLGSDIENLEGQIGYFNSQGINVGVLSGKDDAMQLMRQSIDGGYPLVISVDPRWLPAHDYDLFRTHNSSGGAHGVVIVGYNDTEQTATIIDPGVGSFGEDFGYPFDGRGNYSKVSYYNLADAWGSRQWISVSLVPGGTPVSDVSSRLGPYVRDRLLGTASSYAPGSPYGYIWSFGEAGFRKMSSDMTLDGLTSFLNVFNGIPDEVRAKSLLLLYIGLGLEAQTTLQYLSFRAALERFSSLMPEVNLATFEAEAAKALPHFDAMADNRSLTDPFNVTGHQGVVSSTFRHIVDAYNSTGNLTAALAPAAANLTIISEHLGVIADSWRAAGQALEAIWPTNPFILYAPLIVIGAGGVAVFALASFRWLRKKPSQ